MTAALPVRHAAGFLLALLVGLAAGTAVQAVLRGHLPSPVVVGDAAPGVVVRGPAVRMPADRPARRSVVRPDLRATAEPAAARLLATLYVGDVSHAADAGGIALPAGSRFHLVLSADREGVVEVHAERAEGLERPRAPIWSTRLQAGIEHATPTMKLDGERGLESLRVVLLAPHGTVLAEQQLQIWHL